MEECLEQEPRTYNSLQLAQKLEKERSVKLSPDWLRQVLKKTRRAKFAREVTSQEYPRKLQDFDGIEVVECDEVDVGVNQSVIVANSVRKREPNPGL
ncbi:transposase [Nostoc cycadae WK-1]|uniref:Transposase n=1 Tax=Nostoc cycadae WK-1 TaxID=1861711 RepID=A0A2H6LQG6_9NOSO|nr:transposase [Nostoc cycadae WK-1]